MRLRKPSGRPRKAPPERVEPDAGGHNAGTAVPGTCANTGAGQGALAYEAVAPRLLDIQRAADYLSVSPWTIRDLIANRTLARVRVPLTDGGELRKVLLDRLDLDRLVGASKDAPAP